jgi:hypothetical protein
MDSLAQLIEEFKACFNQCRNEETMRIYKIFEQKIQEKPKFRRQLDFSEYKRFRAELELIDSCLDYVKTDKFRLIRESDGIKIESITNGNEFFTRSTVTLNTNIMKPIAILSENDLAVSW